MQIDWVTMTAQIFNFLILIWLLQRVLYRPIKRALKAREEEVNRTLHEAEEEKQIARTEAQAYREAARELEENRQDRLESVRQEAEALRAELTEKARAEISGLRESWQAQLEQEKAAFLDRLRQRAGEAFVTMMRAALAEMADQDLVDSMAQVFARRLSTLEADERKALQDGARRGDATCVRSSFPLSAEARKAIRAAIADTVDGAIEPSFRESPKLECGVVLEIGSHHVGWTLGAHLDALEHDMARVLETTAEPPEET